MRYLCAMAFIAACSGTKTQSTTMTVGPLGGQVASGDAASVVIPAGALSPPTPVSVSSTSAAAPTDTDAVGTPFLFGPEGTQFAQPVTVTLAFDPTSLPAGSSAADVVIYTAPAGTTDYQPLSTVAADATHVAATTTHFSIFLPAVAHKHKDAGVDAAVPDASLDAGSYVDLSVAESPDLTVAVLSDMSEVDAMPCVPVVNAASQSSCTITAACGGHTYEIDCVMYSFCNCFIDGVQHTTNGNGNLGGTCVGTTGQPAWSYGCNFP